MDINTSTNIPIEVQNYYNNGERYIKKIVPQDDFSLLITFDNEEEKSFDMKQLLIGRVFSPFRDIKKFKTVYIDDCGCPAWDIDPSVDSNCVWNNKVDISKDSCYIYGEKL